MSLRTFLIAVLMAIVAAASPWRPLQAQTIGTGVVWDPPAAFEAAAADLLEMQAVGVARVRTTGLPGPRLARMADSLGMELWRDLPMQGLSRTALADSLAGLSAVLDSLQRAERSTAVVASGPRLRWLGLGDWLDTTDDRVCRLLERLSSQARAAGYRTYYVTPFVEGDACGAVVDRVLLDIRGRTGTRVWLNRYRLAHDGTTVGIGAMGPAVRAGVPDGRNIPGAPLYQARFMEEALHDLAGEAFFIHRWRDGSDAWGKRYGLYTASGNPRPALQVVRGISRDLQQTFALPAQPPQRPSSWPILLGWFLLAFLAVLYAGNPRFRSMLPRYFMAHGFYRNAVREAREVLPLTSTALITLVGLSIGLIGAVFLSGVYDTPVGWYVHGLLPEAWAPTLTILLGAPVVLTILLGCGALVFISVWMGIQVLATGRRNPLLPSQALMLAVWPRWQMIALLPIAMGLLTGPYVTGRLLLGGAWVLCALWASIRTSIDVSRVTRIRPVTAATLWVLNPGTLLVVGMIVWAAAHPDEVGMLWHLL
ncbi:MAG: hypothetical protein RIE53_01670 [Rhodothermales bacterium]